MSFTPVMTAAEVSAFWDEHFPQIRAPRDITIDSIAPGTAILRLVPSERHLRPGGVVSGPTLFTLADVGAYAVLLAHVGPEPMIVTVGMSINFLQRAPASPLLANCSILKLGRKLAVVEVRIRPEGGDELLVHATASYSIPSHADGNEIPRA